VKPGRDTNQGTETSVSKRIRILLFLLNTDKAQGNKHDEYLERVRYLKQAYLKRILCGSLFW